MKKQAEQNKTDKVLHSSLTFMLCIIFVICALNIFFGLLSGHNIDLFWCVVSGFSLTWLGNIVHEEKLDKVIEALTSRTDK